jgi:hypothetical protein
MKIDRNVKRALTIRLQAILDHEVAGYNSWKERIAPKMKPTLASTIDRSHRQRIQALRIVIWMLTPTMERNDDFPGFWKN